MSHYYIFISKTSGNEKSEEGKNGMVDIQLPLRPKLPRVEEPYISMSYPVGSYLPRMTLEEDRVRGTSLIRKLILSG
ncbi:hypothetical protein MTR_4g037585 [Medicago truncatula]|uniref:Uncharacterized protein n=1 Tax=Medicago truncatula TaxID=3880 RepID=A0A072UUF4_MEDTR|nr:hypothetical protein MTR_4g037585 [Medicago truncatula]